MKLVEEYHNNGRLKAIGNVSSLNVKDGLWVYYYDDGTKHKEVLYNDGVDIEWKSWFKNGTIQVEKFRVNEQDWSLKEYYENGNIKEVGVYRNGEYVPLEFWDEDGNHLLHDGTGKKIEKFGYLELDVYEHYFEKGVFIKEVKISSAQYGRFEPKNTDDDL